MKPPGQSPRTPPTGDPRHSELHVAGAGRKLDVRSDIFSFGAVLYEIVTGQRAFRGDTRASTIAAILRDAPTPLPFDAPTSPMISSGLSGVSARMRTAVISQ
jgi:serine/threonine protein kinase